jgi:hypothetical protein
VSRFATALILFHVSPLAALAHDNDNDNESTTEVQGQFTCILSNGAPSHDMGRFPNPATPNAFRAQPLRFCFPGAPRMADSTTTGLMTVGVSLTGVPIRPYTAGYHDPDGQHGFSQDVRSGWRQQAMFKEDFEYQAGSGNLDASNGAIVNGVQTYFATDDYPSFPRGFKGVVNPRFMQRG